ncbi:MAG: cytochrome c [Dehalococcoidia bacterium]
MNTSKQVNAMIGLLFLSFLAFGAYIINEPNRAAIAEDGQDDTFAHRAAELYVNNCRSCHGMTGEGGVGLPLNVPGFLLYDDRNDEGIPETPEGEVRAVREFLFSTIACGRTNTAMPVWSERHGGPLSETQINYLVDLITMGRWGDVEEAGREHDEETGDTPEDILIDPQSEQGQNLSLTNENCGQYGAGALAFRTRDPQAHVDTGTPAPGGEPNGEGEPEGPMVQGLAVEAFFGGACAGCHGQNREGLVGPALTPERLTESDDFYFETIKNGRPGTPMPPWGGTLSDQEIETMVEFITTIEP